MNKYTTFYYGLPSGKYPVREFVDSFDEKTYGKFIFKKELLEEFGPKLPLPHARQMGKGLFELRFTGTDGAIRIFYYFIENEQIILVHGFIKKTDKTPKRDLDLAYKRKYNQQT